MLKKGFFTFTFKGRNNMWVKENIFGKIIYSKLNF